MKIEKLIQYNSFGSLSELRTILKDISKMKFPLKVSDVLTFYTIRDDLSQPIIEASISLLCYLGNLRLTKTNITKVLSEKLDPQNLVRSILQGIAQDKECVHFIKDDVVRFDSEQNKFFIPTYAIPLKYSQIRNLLYSVQALALKGTRAYIYDSYIDIFKEFLFLARDEFNWQDSTKLTLEELKRIQKNRELAGKNAERTALEFEKQRLKGHPFRNRIKIISDISVAEGYDIVSYKDLHSRQFDRFIEVKSYVDKFYWSRNEIEKARLFPKSYCLYLVNNDINDVNIVENPYLEIMRNNQWEKIPDNFVIRMKT